MTKKPITIVSPFWKVVYLCIYWGTLHPCMHIGIFLLSRFEKLLHQRIQGVQFHYYDFFETSMWEFIDPVRMHIIHFLTSNNGSSKWKMPTHDRQNWFDDTINNIDCEAILIDGVKHFAHIEFIIICLGLCFAFKSKVLNKQIHSCTPLP